MGTEYVLVKGEDWRGLYLNGKLVLQDHSIDLEYALNFIIKNGAGITSFKAIECDDNWLEENHELPTNLADAKLLS
jgi:hypothetical protein